MVVKMPPLSDYLPNRKKGRWIIFVEADDNTILSAKVLNSPMVPVIPGVGSRIIKNTFTGVVTDVIIDYTSDVSDNCIAVLIKVRT